MTMPGFYSSAQLPSFQLYMLLVTLNIGQKWLQTQSRICHKTYMIFLPPKTRLCCSSITVCWQCGCSWYYIHWSLYCTACCSTVYCMKLYCMPLYMHATMLHGAILHGAVLHGTVLQSSTLHCMYLYCTAWNCNTRQCSDCTFLY